MHKLTETEKAYLAGIIDGEGCINIARHRTGAGTPLYSLRLVISQANQPFLERWRIKTGVGNIHPNVQLPHVFNWYINGRSAERLLRLVYDYLEIKKDQARIALEFRATKDKRGGYGRRTSQAILNLQDYYKSALCQMKDVKGDPELPLTHPLAEIMDSQLSLF